MSIRATRISIEVGATEPATATGLRAARLAIEVGGGEPAATLTGLRAARTSIEVGGGEPASTLNLLRAARLSIEVGGLDTEPAPPPPAGTIAATWLGVEVGGSEPSSTLNGLRAAWLGLEIGAAIVEEPEQGSIRSTWLGIEVGSSEPADSDGLRAARIFLEIGGTAPEITETPTVDAWFWDAKHNGWWEDAVPTEMRPTCLAVFDADDPGDRVVAVGCADGYLRVLDGDEERDDEFTIESEVLIGPFQLGLPDQEMRVSQLQMALARDQSGATVKFYVSEDPDVEVDDLTPIVIGTLPPGLSPVQYVRARGLYLWVLIQGTVGGAWAYEAGSVVVAPGGRARQR